MIRALLIVALLASTARADMACFQGQPMGASPLPGVKRTIAGTGGVIVVSGGAFPDWRFRDVNRIVRPVITRVAPGLAIYHAPPLAGTDVILENTEHDVMVQMIRGLTVPDVPAAPQIQSITAATTGRDQRTIIANLDGKTPPGVQLAIVSLVARGKTTPLTWTRAAANAGLVVLWHTPGMCEEIVPSAAEPKLGDTVVVTWVDETGRLSEPSKPIVISAASKRK